MIDWHSWLFWPDSVALSVLALGTLVMLFLYAARKPMHGVIHSVCHLVTQSTRFLSRWLFLSAENLRLRNQSVLLAHGQESAATLIEREFERVGNIIRKDMQEYPALQRKLMEEVTRIEEDYRKCGEVPPPPPEWVNALESVSQLKSGGDMPRKLLEDINKSIQKIHDKTVAEYRRAYEDRHKILKGMQPSWRSVDKLMGEMDKKMVTLHGNARQIDGHMAKFEGMRAKDDKTEHALTVVRLRAVGDLRAGHDDRDGRRLHQLQADRAAHVGNGGRQRLHHQQPEDFGCGGPGDHPDGSLHGTVPAGVAAHHATVSQDRQHGRPHASPFDAGFADLPGDPGRHRIVAGLDARHADRRQGFVDARSGFRCAGWSEAGWFSRIPMAGQMIMGFVLPFALAFVAIPLESVVHSLRTVIGVLLVQSMRGLGFVIRFTGVLFKRFAKVLELAYDIPIVIPIMIEQWVVSLRGNSSVKGQTKYGSAS